MADVSPETQALRQALEAANRQVQNLQGRVGVAEGQARQASVNEVAAHEQAVDQAIGQAESKQALAKQKWTTLQQEGEFEKASDALLEMQDASASLAQLRGQKQYLAQQREQMARQPAQQQSGDPLEGFSEAEKAWVREHPAYLSDAAYQARINAAAQNAEHVLRYPRGSEDWFRHINQAAHPERAGNGGDVSGERRETQETDDESAFSDTGEGNNNFPGEHTRDMPHVSTAVETQEMRVGTNGEAPQDPQERAIGRGGGGISATAAAPSRRIQQLSDPMRRGQATLSQDELAAAIEMVSAIEPTNSDGSRKTPQQMAETYYAWAHSPTHKSARRRSWAADSIIA